MNKKIMATFVGSLLAISFPLLASDVSIVFGNGMQTTMEDAEHSLIVLKDSVEADPRFADMDVDFHLAYNKTVCKDAGAEDGGVCMRDLYEAVRQEAISVNLRIDDTTFWSYVSRLRTTPGDEFDLFSRVAASSPSFSGPDTVFEADLGRHVALYQDIISRGGRLVLVAHSQGNFFGNDAFDLLTAEQRSRFGMVSVATPARDVLGDSSEGATYTTLQEDPIHQRVPTSLDFNLSNFEGGYTADPQWTFHGFAGWYMKPQSPSREKILGDILRVSDTLSNPPALPGFTRISDMTSPRVFHCAVRLDGKVLVAGGFAPNRTPLNSAELYDPATRTFSPTGTMISRRGRGITCTRLEDGRVLVAGGEVTPFVYTSSAEVYNPATGSFSPVGGMTTPRGEGWHAFAVSGGALLFGGTFEGNFGTATAAVDRFDAGSNTISRVGTLLGSRRDYTAQALPDGSILLIGGVQNFSQQAFPVVERYDTITHQSVQPGQPNGTPRTRSWGSAPLPEGSVLVVSGVGLQAEVYNPASDSFSILTSSPSFFAGDFGKAVALSDGRVLLLGYGRSPGEGGRIAEIFDPLSGTFTALGSFAVSGPSCEGYAATPLADGTVLITGGGEPPSCDSKPLAEIFRPGEQ